MAMVLEAFVKNFAGLLTDYVAEEGAIQLGVKDELQKLQEQMMNIQCLLKDAERRKIESHKLLADQNPESKISPVCCNFSSFFSCLASVPLRHEIGNKIKEINKRLKRIYKNRKQFNLESLTESETQVPDDSRLTSSMASPSDVGREVDDVARRLVNHLVGENVDEKCRIFAVTGMGGKGKTTIAQKNFNYPKIQTFFNLKLWVCVSQNQSGIESLKQVISGVDRRCRDDSTKIELQGIVRDSIVAGKSLFLVLDNLWTASVWINWLGIPLIESNVTVRVLVTTRHKNVVVDMRAVHIHRVELLSEESSWDMLCRRLFSAKEVELANELKELGFKIVQRCKGLPLAIKVLVSVLARQERTKCVWHDFLQNDAWSIKDLPDELSGALYLSFEDLPTHRKQCFQYLSLFPEDTRLFRSDVAQLWVSEGFVTKHERKLMEQLAEGYFDELLKRNLLLRNSNFEDKFELHGLIRSLASSIALIIIIFFATISNPMFMIQIFD
ncbi:hypothetical protein IEQ34_017931 [Dendrobium chrysotoxum]|uniref:NB-ARC domain-containing protein n=1 Tax=Dendrobium chrysotoxum TaxID=161865 RepID=A0AAV7GCT9_DENCH|nr:hypothetical protein IEQ34_017931 [Dendrobium chrysotoxum]